MRRRLVLVALTACLLGSTGCGTLHNIGYRNDGPAIYGGVAFDIDLLDPANSCKGEGVVLGPLDMPFSFALDTATLPITLLCELFGWRRSADSR